ncbi:MAG: T9SS type A sorting domain-containing protein, partial [Lentimicrobium sp.]|nr:T9SS type A sorting domain-containing protein [Lentimicrobium sp.]
DLWRDRRNSADTGYAASYEIFCATRLKTAPDFSSNFRISDDIVPFDDVLLGNGNDFMCTELYNDTLSSVWGDTRNGKLNIWFQRVTLDGMLVSAQNLASEIIPAVEVIPINPGNRFRIQADNLGRIIVSDLSGKKLFQSESLKGTNEFLLDLSGFPSAFYIISIEAGFGKISKKILSK